MKKFFLLILSLSPTPLLANEPYPLAFAGFSLGGTVGYGIGEAQVSSGTNFAVPGTRYDNYAVSSYAHPGFSGIDGGLITGYLQRFGNWGLGADFLANWTSTNGSRNAIAGFTHPTISHADIQTLPTTIKIKNSLQVRGVFSYVLSELLMPKIMLGWDNSQYDVTYQQATAIADGGSLQSISAVNVAHQKRLNGLLWGAGVDFLVAQNVVMGLEYTGVASVKKMGNTSFNGRTSYGGQSFPLAGTASGWIRPKYNTFKATLKYVLGGSIDAAAPKKSVPTTAFAGFSLGGTMGYGIGKATLNSTTSFSYLYQGNIPTYLPFRIQSHAGISGVDGGLITGYLKRFGNWGLGADFLANWANTRGSENDMGEWTASPTHLEDQMASVQIKMNNALQVRGVFSYIIANRMMPKIMLGWDNSHYTFAYDQTTNLEGGLVGSALITTAKRLNGFLWGAGVDFLVARGVVFGLEYTGVLSSKATFNSAESGTTSVAAGGLGVARSFTATSSASLHPQYNTFKGTLKYIF